MFSTNYYFKHCAVLLRSRFNFVNKLTMAILSSIYNVHVLIPQVSRNIIVIDWGVGSSKYGTEFYKRDSATYIRHDF